ncbi:MAG: RsmE family RNA methyltransferase [Desulfomonilia bacterium]
MPRFFADMLDSTQAVIKAGDARHILGPLRMKVGDEVPIRDGEQGFRAKIIAVRRGQVVLEIMSREHLFERGSSRVRLAMGLIALKDMDDVIRFATELGVADIHPVVSSRSNIKEISKARARRWDGIAREAVKQCQRRSIPVIHEAEPLETLIDQRARTWKTRLVARQGAARSIFSYRGDDVGVLIGPEGGFTPDELGRIEKAGFTPVSLGDITLRSVTAAITAVGVLAQD